MGYLASSCRPLLVHAQVHLEQCHRCRSNARDTSGLGQRARLLLPQLLAGLTAQSSYAVVVELLGQPSVLEAAEAFGLLTLSFDIGCILDP